MTDRATAPNRPASRGPRCARLDELNQLIQSGKPKKEGVPK